MHAVEQDRPSPAQKLAAIERELNRTFLEREEQIRGLLCALLASENVLLLGLPGAAKSALIRDLCERVSGGGRYFRTLLTRFSTPEQILGPWSVQGLANDSYTRKSAGYLPEADLAFVDEIFKANSAVLNELLPILNEREVFTDGSFQRIPLKMVVGASNEMPHDRNELDALWDRFMVRFTVSYLSDAAFRDLISPAASGSHAAGPKTRLGEDDLASLRRGVESLDTRTTARTSSRWVPGTARSPGVRASPPSRRSWGD